MSSLRHSYVALKPTDSKHPPSEVVKSIGVLPSSWGAQAAQEERHAGSPAPPCLLSLPAPPGILVTSCPAFWRLEKLQDVEEVSSSSLTAWGAGEQDSPFLSVQLRARRSSRALGGTPTRCPASGAGEGRAP